MKLRQGGIEEREWGISKSAIYKMVGNKLTARIASIGATKAQIAPRSTDIQQLVKKWYKKGKNVLTQPAYMQLVSSLLLVPILHVPDSNRNGKDRNRKTCINIMCCSTSTLYMYYPTTVIVYTHPIPGRGDSTISWPRFQTPSPAEYRA